MSNQLMRQEEIDREKKILAKELQRLEPGIKQALPKHMSADVVIRTVLTTVTKNPALLQCTRPSLWGAIIQASQLGLMPDDVLGQAWLIPYNQKTKAGGYVKVCQFQIGYKGLIQLIRRSGDVDRIVANAVYKQELEDELFDYDLAEGIKLHKRSENTSFKDEDITHFYALIRYKSGGYDFAVMTKPQVDKHAKKYSQNYGDKYSPWTTNYEAMGKKTVLIQAAKFAELSTEIQKTVTLEEMMNEGKNQKNSSYLDTIDIPVEMQNAVQEGRAQEQAVEDGQETDQKNEQLKEQSGQKSEAGVQQSFPKMDDKKTK